MLLFLCSPENDYESWSAGSRLGTGTGRNTVNPRTGVIDRISKSVAKRKSHWAGVLVQESQPASLWLWLPAHGVANSVARAAVFSFLPSRLVCTMEYWSLEAGFPFPNANFTSCTEMLNMLEVARFLIYQYVAR